MSRSENLTRPPLVLIANDQEWSARSLESILGPAGYAVLRAYTGRQALELARSAQPDVLVIDVRLPDIDGADVCRTIRDDPRVSDTTPILMTSSGPLSRSQRAETYRAGAWEICAQPLDGEILLVKLETFMRSKREVDRVREENLVDDLTGLYNMRGLARRAREMGAEAFRRHDPLACVVFGPDIFASGSGGDGLDAAVQEAIRRIGEVFRTTGRVSDAIGRLGQSEFAIIALRTEANGVLRLVDRFRAAVEGATVTVAGSEVPMRLRAGYYAVPDFASASVDAVEMLLRATAALHHTRTSDGVVLRSFDALPSEALSCP
ncbi:MAG: response regulator [Gemmatimonadaceae bacterium]